MAVHRWVALAAAVVCSAAGAEQLAGSPRYTLWGSGPLLSTGAGRFGVKAAPGDGVGRFVIIDGHRAQTPDAVIAEVTLDVRDGAAPIATADRHLTFSAAGWREQAGIERDLLQVEVVALAGSTFGVVLRAPAAFSVDVRVQLSVVGAPQTQGQIATVAAEGWALSLSGGGSLAASDGALRIDGLGGGAIHAVVLAIAPTAQASEEQVTQALTNAGDAATWLTRAQDAFAQQVARASPIAAPSDARRALNEAALAQLLANETEHGFLANKSHRNLHWLWDSVLQATGLVEVDAARAMKALTPHLRTRVSDGPLHARVDATLQLPPIEGGAQDFTQLAPLGLALRAIQDRTDVEPARLRDAYEAGVDWVDWYARERDRDADFRYELNGALEHPQPGSPRFAAFWGEFGEVLLPLPQTSPRPSLNAVDVQAWVGHLSVELARLGTEVSADTVEVVRLRERALGISGRLEEPTEGSWSTDGAAWFDFVRVGEERTRTFGAHVRTPAIWSPLGAGMARDSEHIVTAVQQSVLDEAFFGPRGISSTREGTISVADTWLTVLGLYRYGFEEEARTLNSSLVELLASHPNLHDEYAADGTPLGAGGSGAAAAIATLALRDRHEEETFALHKGGVAAQRTGRIRRLFRMNDGRLLMEVSVDGTHELPVTTIKAAHQIFSGETMTLSFADPDGVIGERTIEVLLPVVAEAEVTLRRKSGAEERTHLSVPEGGTPASLSVAVGDELDVRIVRFAGERGACGCASGGEAAAAAGVLALAYGALRRRRRRRC